MKPQFHPSADDITVESILYALSDPARAQIFAAIARSKCAQTCAAFLDSYVQNLKHNLSKI